MIGDSLAPVCTEVGGTLGLQEGTHDVTLPVKLPPNTGTYTLTVQGAGIYGGFHSVDCNDSVVGTGSFGGALRVTADATDSSTGSTGGAAPSWVAQMIAAIVAAIKPASAPVPTPAPTTSAACTAYAQANAGTQPNKYSDTNVRLQGFLLSQGASIPALKAGASFGFYGNQTTAAVGWFNSLNHCQ